MKELSDSVRNAIGQRNWYACLALALALPDICGFLESPNDRSQRRYVAWCDQFLVPRYTREIGPSRTQHSFLSGQDCYALRCAFLHEGSDDVTRQRARQALESFVFVEPPAGGMIRCNQSDAKLQLQVDIFCEDVCAGVDHWVQTVLGAQLERPSANERDDVHQINRGWLEVLKTSIPCLRLKQILVASTHFGQHTNRALEVGYSE